MKTSDYPPDWPRIRARILKRASKGFDIARCECFGECGLHIGRRCVELNGRRAIFARGRVVLTIAHLCRKSNCPRIDHLKAMCQRCHLRYDVRQHYTSRRIRWERDAGQEQAKLLACLAPWGMVPFFYGYFQRQLTALRLAAKAIARREGN